MSETRYIGRCYLCSADKAVQQLSVKLCKDCLDREFPMVIVEVSPEAYLEQQRHARALAERAGAEIYRDWRNVLASPFRW